MPELPPGGGGNPPTIVITNGGNKSGTVGVPVTVTIQATNTAGNPLTYAAYPLPAGLSVNASTGQITGTPTSPGAIFVEWVVTDAVLGNQQVATFTWTIAAAPGGGGGGGGGGSGGGGRTRRHQCRSEPCRAAAASPARAPR
ncbi:MAG: putative Ig domain-containing protein, partial [Solirubrobacteraceae bacterium]